MRPLLARISKLYRERRAFRWGVELLGFALVVLAISAWQTRHHVRGAAPALRLTTLDGAPASLASAGGAKDGKKTLLYVWATWCGVCKAEAQNIEWVRSIVGDRARVISIATGYENPDEVKRYVAAHPTKYPVLLGDDSVPRALNVQGYPTIYFLDADGKISGSVAGYTTTLGLWWRLVAQ